MQKTEPPEDRSLDEVLRELMELGKELQDALDDSQNLHLSLVDLRTSLAHLRQTLRSAAVRAGEEPPGTAAEEPAEPTGGGG